MTVHIVAIASPGEVQVAAVSGGELVDYALWRPGLPNSVGDLHRGRIIAQVPAMAGRFVALTDGEGFLPDTAGGDGLSEGTVLGVRVVRAAQGGKGPRLTARLSAAEQTLVGHGPPALLRRGPGAIELLAALHPDATVTIDDPAMIAELRPRLGNRLELVREPPEDEIMTAIEGLAATSVSLPSGGTLHVHPTPALVAIDLDTGNLQAGRSSKAAAQLAFNRAALPFVTSQIRLRNLSGAILVDLAGLPARRRSALGPDLAAALAADPLRPRLLGFTALGLAEIVRPRVHPPLHELLAGPYAAGLAVLRAAARASTAEPSLVPTVRAAPAVVAALEADPVALPALARRTGRHLILRSDPTLPETAWTLEMR